MLCLASCMSRALPSRISHSFARQRRFSQGVLSCSTPRKSLSPSQHVYEQVRHESSLRKFFAGIGTFNPLEDLPGGFFMANNDETGSFRSGASSSTKRKRDAGPKFYAVRVGNAPGIYHSWSDCLDQVKGVKGAVYKSFPSLTDAEAFLHHTSTSAASPTSSVSSSKYYAVQSGRVPGVYNDWQSAQAQIAGWPKPKHKSFMSRAEAEAFVKAGAADIQGDIAAKPAGQTNGTKKHKAAQGDKPTPAKRQKRLYKKAELIGPDENGVWPPGYGPLPPDAEDGFDERLILNPDTGKIEYKTEAQLHATKPMPVADTGMLKIWTDGSSLGNGKLGSSAGIGVYFGPGDKRNISAPLPANQRQTNQRAELLALQRALELTPADRPVTIYSDSSYAINCATTWSGAWIRNGWLTSARKPVENRDLVEGIVAVMQKRKRGGVGTELVWVKGHGSDEGNEAADRLAVAGAKRGREERAAEGTGG